MPRNKHKKMINNFVAGSLQPAKVIISPTSIPEHALDELKKSYKLFQSYFPLLERFKDNTKTLSSTKLGLHTENTFPENTDDVYVKVVHLLNPDDWIQGDYSFTKDTNMPGLTEGWTNVVEKLQCEENQAYIDTLASYLLSQLVEQNISPHFVKFYGATCAKADKYCYNISEEFQSYKNTKWFWHALFQKIFALRVFSNEKDRFLTPDELKSFLLTPSEVDLLSEDDNEDDDNKSETLDTLPLTGDSAMRDDLESVSSSTFGGTGSVRSLLRVSPSNQTVGDNSDGEYEEDDGEDFFVEFEGMPVMLIFMEKLKGVMDNLLDEAPFLEEKWTAWIWQVIAALCQSHAFIEIYHNDLHGNNILYKETDKEFLYYRTKDGTVWRVPTFGKIFCLIDYGRSIYRVSNQQQLISDEFFDGNSAAGQYNFGHIRDPKTPAIPPNISFDLVRLAVSIFNTLFEHKPAEKVSPIIGVLSREGSWVVKETVSPLYNLMWSWMIDDKGKNVLHDQDGTERFPGFDLYKHIAAHCKGAIPKEQLRKPIFENFKYSGQIPEDTHIYPLFV